MVSNIYQVSHALFTLNQPKRKLLVPKLTKYYFFTQSAPSTAQKENTSTDFESNFFESPSHGFYNYTENQNCLKIKIYLIRINLS